MRHSDGWGYLDPKHQQHLTVAYVMRHAAQLLSNSNSEMAEIGYTFMCESAKKKRGLHPHQEVGMGEELRY